LLKAGKKAVWCPTLLPLAASLALPVNEAETLADCSREIRAATRLHGYAK